MDDQRKFGESFDCLFRILVIGNEDVGKSSLIQRFIDGTFTQNSTTPTIGFDFKLKYIDIAGQRVLLQVWDAAGRPRYRDIVKHVFSKMMGIILVFDVTSTSSLAALGGWIEDIRQFALHGVQVIVLGSKCDQSSKRIVTPEEMIQYAQQLNVIYMESSSKNNFQINKVFDVLINQIINRMNHVIRSE